MTKDLVGKDLGQIVRFGRQVKFGRQFGRQISGKIAIPDAHQHILSSIAI